MLKKNQLKDKNWTEFTSSPKVKSKAMHWT